MRVFLDSNIWIAYLTQRNEIEFKSVNQLINLAKEGRITPYSSNIVFLEVFFVLVSLYKFNKLTVGKDLTSLFDLRNLVIIEKTDTRKAFEYCQQFQIKLADAFVATQIPEKVILSTFDKEFKKLTFLESAVPNEIITRFNKK